MVSAGACPLSVLWDYRAEGAGPIACPTISLMKPWPMLLALILDTGAHAETLTGSRWDKRGKGGSVMRQ